MYYISYRYFTVQIPHDYLLTEVLSVQLEDMIINHEWYHYP